MDDTKTNAIREKKIYTKDSVSTEINDLVEMIDKKIETYMKSTDKQPNIRNLRKIRKRLVVISKHVIKIKNRRKANSEDFVGGFSRKYPVSDELCKFLDVPKNTEFSISDVQRAICAYVCIKPDEIRETVLEWEKLNPILPPKEGRVRDLQDPENKRKIIPDKKLEKLLSYNSYVSDVKAGKVFRKDKKTGEKVLVTDYSLNYCIIMKLVQRHFKRPSKVV